MNLTWHCKAFNDLTTQQLYDIMQLRNEVFVVEQDCVYQDADGKDPKCMHVFGLDANYQVLAYARVVPAGLSYIEPAIGRIVTSPSIRRTGLGRVLMQQSMAFLEDLYGPTLIRISAQCYLEAFYKDFGFNPVGDTYLEDGIPHIEMLRI